MTNEIKLHEFSAFKILIRQLKNPLLLIFIVSTIVAFILGQKVEAFAIWFIMFISVGLGFWNEYQAEKVVHDLLKKISYSATVIRDGVKEIIPVKDVCLGDIVILHPGSIIPADIKISKTENLEINEAVLTGESLPISKKVGDFSYMGTIVTTGGGEGEVIAIGVNTRFGKISLDIVKVRPETEFQKGLRDFSSMLTKVAGIMVVFIIVFNFFLGKPMVETVLFALTVAMGVAPELLPLIVTISLSYGAKRLAKLGVIIKQFVSIEDLGNMEILCTDKTGTLTEGEIFLNSFINSEGKRSERVLNFALICNSVIVHQKVFGDAIDKAIWEYAQENKFEITCKFVKIFESPFDFENRFMSVVIKSEGKVTLIVKGSPEAILELSRLGPNEKKDLGMSFNNMQKDGLRVIAIGTKTIEEKNIKYQLKQIKNLKFEGYLSFRDIPKKDVKEALDKFEKLGVQIKIITGDSEIITKRVCEQVGLIFNKILLGTEIEKISDINLEKEVLSTDIFARVTPTQKNRIILSLKKSGKTVGYMGDGVNDGPAIRNADVGISVNTGVDVAKDAASVVLLKKNLSVIAEGIKEGRRTFNNTIKYILMVTSSSFGNMLSASCASVFLPFLPMTPVQVLLTDFLYDMSQLVVPTDNVDEDQILKPKRWDIKYIKRFMLFFGPISSIYDFITFALMYFVFHARGSLFQTGWFVESLITEVMVVFVIRTRIVPFFKSKPSIQLIFTCIGVSILGLILPFSPLHKYLEFTPLPPLYFEFLILLIVTYLGLVEVGKIYLNKRLLKNIET